MKTVVDKMVTNMYVSPGFIQRLNSCIEQGGKECPICQSQSVEIIGFNFVVEGNEHNEQRKRAEFDLSCSDCGKRFCGPVMYSQVGRISVSGGMSQEQRIEADKLLEQDLIENGT